jgi:hypothetical protein
MVESMGELDATARNVGLVALPQLERKIRRNLLSGLVKTALAGKDAAG